MARQRYEDIGHGYARYRRPDPRIQAAIDEALGDCRTVVNVGAGTGSYEPAGRDVVAVEPSRVMLSQRPRDSVAVRGVGEALPFRDRSFEAAMAVLTIHHWTDWRRGLREMQRVSTGPVVVLTHDLDAMADFWLRDYFPTVIDPLRVGMPPPAEVAEWMSGETRVIPVPPDCTDGFLGAYWRRPERYLDPGARAAISAFPPLPPAELEPGLARLSEDIANGAWERRHADLLAVDAIDLGYRLIVAAS